MQRILPLAAVLALAAFAFAEHHKSADNTLTDKEKADGWRLLFNGKDHTGWMNNNGKPIASAIEDHALQTKGCGGYVLMHEKQYTNFVLRCDVKMQKPHGNSGIFFRVANPKNPVHSGYEAQIEKGGTGLHSFGAIYDLVPAKVNALNGPGEWNRYELTCDGPMITVKVNGKLVAEMNTDAWTEVGKRPDGTKHKFKFKVPIKDLHRTGYLGFQDHGAKVWFKNVKLKELPSADAPKPE